MKIQTHKAINRELCGIPQRIDKNIAIVSMESTNSMLADESGLIHGGFLFSLADHAAMLAVNHPNVVLGESSCRFIKPVVLGDTILAEARLVHSKNKKHEVNVSLRVDSKIVFSGTFICFTPDKHVLDN